MAPPKLSEDIVSFVDDQGRIRDLTSYPPAHPATQTGDGRKERRKQFTPDQERMLLQWCAAAEVQGLPNQRIFQLLQTVVSARLSPLFSFSFVVNKLNVDFFPRFAEA